MDKHLSKSYRRNCSDMSSSYTFRLHKSGDVEWSRGTIASPSCLPINFYIYLMLLHAASSSFSNVSTSRRTPIKLEPCYLYVKSNYYLVWSSGQSSSLLATDFHHPFIHKWRHEGGGGPHHLVVINGLPTKHHHQTSNIATLWSVPRTLSSSQNHLK